MVCHNTSNKSAHHTKDCPILRQLGFKLVMCTPADGGDAASRVRESPAPAPAPAAPAPAPAVSVDGGSTGTPGAFTAATEADCYDSGKEFDYEGKYEGFMYTGNPKSNLSVYPNASHATAEPLNTSSESKTNCRRTTSSIDPHGVRTTPLPKHVNALLQNPPAHSTALVPGAAHSLLVADTGATDHMILDKSVFISYRPVSGRGVRMGNNSFAPILGSGSAVIAINGKHILIRECLHVPALRNPLYSLRAHQCQHGCGFIGMQGLGMYVIFPSFIVQVNTATDCHLSYAPIGHAATISSLDYVQPIQAQNSGFATASTPAPVVIEADDNNNIPPNALPTYVSHWPKKPPALPAPPVVLPVIPPPAYSVRLKELTRKELIQRLYSVEHTHCLANGDDFPAQQSPPFKLECMSDEEIVATLHHPHSRLPPVRPCDTRNASETKRTYTPEELH